MQRFTNKDKNLVLESNGKCSCSTSIRFAAERLVHTKIKKTIPKSQVKLIAK